jgi:hypothetical protein
MILMYLHATQDDHYLLFQIISQPLNVGGYKILTIYKQNFLGSKIYLEQL